MPAGSIQVELTNPPEPDFQPQSLGLSRRYERLAIPIASQSRFPRVKTMNRRTTVLLAAAATAAVTFQSDASAFGRRNGPGPVMKVVQVAIPSQAELRAVPVPHRGEFASYPADVVRYGLTVHPGARVVTAASRGEFRR